MVVWNTIILGVTVILIGYSSFALIIIRSSAKPPMDQNSPNNIFALLSYLNRDQYGQRPLFYGQYFNSPLNPRERYLEGNSVYSQIDGKYVITDKKVVLIMILNLRLFSRACGVIWKIIMLTITNNGQK